MPARGSEKQEVKRYSDFNVLAFWRFIPAWRSGSDSTCGGDRLLPTTSLSIGRGADRRFRYLGRTVPAIMVMPYRMEHMIKARNMRAIGG